MRFLARRLGFYALTAWAAITLNFVIPRLMPGNPVQAVIAREHLHVTSQAVKSLSAAFGVDTHAGIVSQYFSYLGNVLHGVFGVSISYYPASVLSVIGTALPWTLLLVGSATIISFVLGSLLGVWTAWKRGTWVDHLVPFTAFFAAMPYFWLGSIAIMLFAIKLGWFPLSGAYDPSMQINGSPQFVLSVLDYGFLPAATIVISSVAGWLLGMRNVMINTLAEDFITMAQAKGLSDRRVMLAYAARNALLPQVTSFAIQLGYVVSGLLLIEYVFSYPGVGYTLVNAVQAEDYPLMQALFLLISISVLAANLIADLLYARLDPRVRNT